MGDRKPLKMYSFIVTARRRTLDGTQSWEQFGVQIATSEAEAFFIVSKLANEEWFPASKGYSNVKVCVMEVSPRNIEKVYLSQKGIL